VGEIGGGGRQEQFALGDTPKIAQVLEARFLTLMETQPELVAQHYTAAGCAEQAVVYWQRAGQHASDRSAYLEAVSHFTTGIELLKSLPETPERTQYALTLHIALGAALQTTKGHTAPEVEYAYTQRLFEKSCIGGLSAVPAGDARQSIPPSPHGGRLGSYPRGASTTQARGTPPRRGEASGGHGALGWGRRGHARTHAAPCVSAVAQGVLGVPPRARQRRRAAGGMGEPAAALPLAGHVAAGRGSRRCPAPAQRGGGAPPGVAQAIAPCA